MAFEPVFDKIECEFEQVDGAQQTTIETTFAPDGKPDRVLALTARVSEGEVEQGHKSQVRGFVTFTLVYVMDGQIKKLEQVEPFEEIVSIKTGQKAKADMRIIDCETEVQNAKIKASATVEIKIISSFCQEAKYVCPQLDGVYVKEEHHSFVKAIKCSSEVIPFSQSIKFDASEVVAYFNRCVLNSASAKLDAIAVDCEVITTVLFKKDGNLASAEFITPINEEIECNGVGFSDSVFAKCKIKNSTLETDSDNENSYSVSGEIKVDYSVYGESEFTHLVDAFCPQRQLLSVTEDCMLCSKNSTYYCSDRIDGSFSLDDGLECDKIIANIDFVPTITSVSVSEGKVDTDGVLSGTILYYNEEKNENCTQKVFVPFSTSFRLPVSDESAIIEAQVSSLVVKCRRGTEFDVKADLCFVINVSKTESVPLITDLQEGEEYEKCDYGFSVYSPSKGETLWEVARTLGCSPDDITSQNECAFPTCGNERIVVYRKLCR